MHSVDPVRRGRRSIGAPRACAALVAMACLALGCAATRAAEPAPDSAQVATARAGLAGAARARVLAGGRTLFLARPTVTATGLAFRSLTVREGFAYSTLEQAAPIPWRDIASVEVQRSRAGRGAALGFVLGTIAGLAIGLNQPCHHGFILGGEGNCVSRRVPPVLVGGLCGAAIGGLSARRYDRWIPLYP